MIVPRQKEYKDYTTITSNRQAIQPKRKMPIKEMKRKVKMER